MTWPAWCRVLRGSVVTGALAAALAVSGQAAAQTAGDFNGDRRDDLAIGVPFEDVGIIGLAGAVNVLYGRDGGLRARGDQFWHQNSVGVEDGAEEFDTFGNALAAGDFDNDGFDDLAVGVPFEDIGTINAAGAVNVLYGSATGLSADGDQFWSQAAAGVEGGAEASDGFGWALAVGDFDDDGFDDLAIGVPFEDIGTIIQGGAVNVLYGSPGGLAADRNQSWHQDSADILGFVEADDLFGRSLATGDFDNDGFDDLAIGVLFEDIGAIMNAGAVNVLYGSSTGLAATGNQSWHQDVQGIKGVVEPLDSFGTSLAAGDFNGDRRDDLAIGAQFDNVGTLSGGGAVNVLYGSSTGLAATGNQIWHQNRKQNRIAVKEVAEINDRFGFALAAGDLNADGFDDLAVGVPGESVGTKTQAGAVNVLYGTAKGLKTKGNQLWHQDRKGIGEKAAKNDFFGRALTMGKFNKGRARDLAIGVPFEDIGTISRAGAVNVIYGSNAGLTAEGDQVWHQNKKGVKDSAETDDNFGEALP